PKDAKVPKDTYQKNKEESGESSKALVTQYDEGYDWGKQYDDLMGAFMATLDGDTFGKGKDKVDELTADLIECTEANKKLISREKSFDKKIIDLGKEIEDLKIKVLQNNHDASVHLESVQKLKVELSAAKTEAEVNKSKLENYQNSQHVIDYFVSMQRSSHYTTGLGFHSVPPPPSYVSRPQINPDLEVHPVSLNECVSEQVTEAAAVSSSDDKVCFDNDAPIIEDITESAYSSDILRQNGYLVNTDNKLILKSQNSKVEMKPAKKVVVKSKVVNKPVLKAKSNSILKPVVANYVAPEDDAWRHADSESDSEIFDNDDDENQQQPPPPPPRQPVKKAPAKASNQQKQTDDTSSTHVDCENVEVEDVDEESSDTESEFEMVQVGNHMVKRLKKKAD
ncbi:hypothetical protein R6Q57_011209, partial [Mikania cordata]